MSTPAPRSALAVLAFAAAVSGCAVHYYDAKTGTEHIWGVGHMAMKVSAPEGGHQALVRGTDVIGLSVGREGGEGYVTLGWERRQRVEILHDNTTVGIEWPKASLFNVRVGSPWPRGAEFDGRGGAGE